MINFYGATKIYPPNTAALKNVSFKVKDGEFVAIAGRSGAGKTTLLKLLIGQEPLSKGQIFFNSQRVSDLTSKELLGLRRNIGMVFQDYKLLPDKTVFENLSYVMEVMGFTKRQIQSDISKVLEIVNLEDRLHSFPIELSGGEVQRTAIARALIHRPDVVLADEPTGNLDPYHSHDIIALLKKVNEMGATVLLATHNKDVIKSLNTRVITLEQGRLIRDMEHGKYLL